jgi:hypothetical protein
MGIAESRTCNPRKDFQSQHRRRDYYPECEAMSDQEANKVKTSTTKLPSLWDTAIQEGIVGVRGSMAWIIYCVRPSRKRALHLFEFNPIDLTLPFGVSGDRAFAPPVCRVRRRSCLCYIAKRLTTSTITICMINFVSRNRRYQYFAF